MADNDHDLLITLKGKVEDVLTAIKELKEGTAEQIKDHESRLRRLELWGGLAVGGLTVIQFVLNYIK